jgi:hypothetical protein
MKKVEYKSRAWLILQLLREGGAQPRASLVEGEDKDGNTAIGNLLRSKWINVLPDGQLAITFIGVRRLREANTASNGLGLVAKRTIGTGTTTEPYDGREMRRTCLRPGAYDAFELPSLIGNERHYRKEIKA